MQPNKKNINPSYQSSNRRGIGSRSSTQPSQLPGQQNNNNNGVGSLK